ncbi:DinB family protein [Nostoc sp. NIES-2111]
MISPSYVRTMAAYNRAMNASLYGAAALLDDSARKADRGLFWTSVHGTLAHLLWADRIQMSRLAGWPAPAETVRESGATDTPFDVLAGQRAETDAALCDWAAGVGPADLMGEIAWYSGARQQHVRTSRALLVAHLFNHQTHHRGQVHALLTGAGVATGDTDLWILVPEPL